MNLELIALSAWYVLAILHRGRRQLQGWDK